MSLVPAAVGSLIARNALIAQKSSPKVLFVAGVVGVTASTVLACRATLKMDDIVEEAKEKLDIAKTLEHPEYSEEDRSRDISLIYFQSGVKIAKAYAPAVLLGAASIYALTRSHNLLTKQVVGLTAAYGALEKGFAQYRGRVIDKYGEQADQEFRYGIEKVDTVDPDTGKKKSVTRIGPDADSIYARFFDPTSPSWDRNPEYNMIFLQCQQQYANDMLHSRGHIFLNEVYDMLGIPRSKAGSVVGWVLSKDGSTDNFVNFGVFDGTTQVARDFVNGREGSILLDFNVDGVIYDKLEG